MELVDGHCAWPMRSVRVEIPRFKQDQIESGAYCPRVLVKVEGGGRHGYYVSIGFTCAEATQHLREGKRLRAEGLTCDSKIVVVEGVAVDR